MGEGREVFVGGDRGEARGGECVAFEGVVGCGGVEEEGGAGYCALRPGEGGLVWGRGGGWGVGGGVVIRVGVGKSLGWEWICGLDMDDFVTCEHFVVTTLFLRGNKEVMSDHRFVNTTVK